MEWESVLGELVEFIKNVAPDVWSTFVRQVYINAWGFAIAAIALSVTAIPVIRGGNKAKLSNDHDTRDTAGFFYTFGVGLLAIALLCVFLAFSRFVNPEYFVVRDLLTLISGE